MYHEYRKWTRCTVCEAISHTQEYKTGLSTQDICNSPLATLSIIPSSKQLVFYQEFQNTFSLEDCQIKNKDIMILNFFFTRSDLQGSFGSLYLLLSYSVKSCGNGRKFLQNETKQNSNSISLWVPLCNSLHKCRFLLQ